ncbi:MULTISPECIES: FAD:protein FMN transferase [unclassified Pseudoalteromonas]|uniref:FAD:protein FMN transferase n=1 Tax=unclassified Pseudoalteromonas TaxID=194690 RepID=UPI000C08CA47|nr:MULTISPECIES: FAD:protein FMN transferase [unclassified Pseudoalteromonas]MDP2636053.1 FAD:protein FMN transferase [Pseudoalteromonas sp. 1_MG-2023]PHN90628.1 FAD:protein FMN transferase ApbE [Pseudoalteromonas sp. 3D05]
MNKVFHPQAFVAFLFIFITLFISGCGQSDEPKELYLEGRTMGTTYHIKAYAKQDKLDSLNLLPEVNQLLKDVNQSMSTYIKDSEINNFNRIPAGQVMPISADFRAVVAESIRLGESTKTLDVTMGPLIDLWGFGPDKKPTKRPTDEALASMVANIGVDKLKLTEQGLAKTIDGLELSFSATAKGYGIDKVAELLERHGITDYMVEIGGELRISGKKPNAKEWRIAIEQPDAEPGTRKVHRILAPGNNGMATSGDYRIFYEMDGVTYSHLIDPVTGMPTRHDLVSVTVLHPSAMTADGLATALTIMGMNKAQAYAEKNDLAVYLIAKSKDGLVTYSSPAFKPYL